MLTFICWLIVGLVAGGLARLLIPGKQPMTVLLTMVLGLIGSIVGGLISTIIFGYNAGEPGFHAGGLIMSTIGALIVLGGYITYSKKKVA